MVIACNSYQLFTQRKSLQAALGNSITLLNEQTSSHQTVAEALLEFRVCFPFLNSHFLSVLARNNLSKLLRACSRGAV